MADLLYDAILGSPSVAQKAPSEGVQPISEEDLKHPNVIKGLQYINAYEGKPKANQMFGYREFNDLSKHPNIKIPFTDKGDTTTAAGTYQITAPTWEEQAKKQGLKDFSPENQNKAAVGIMRDIGALDAFKEGNFDKAKQLLGTKWAGIPGSTIGKSTGQIPKLNAEHEAILPSGDMLYNAILGNDIKTGVTKTATVNNLQPDVPLPVQNVPKKEEQMNWFQRNMNAPEASKKLQGAGEAIAAIATSPLVAGAGMVKGLVQSLPEIAGGKAPQIAEKIASDFQKEHGYSPTSEKGKEYLQSIGETFKGLVETATGSSTSLPPIIPELVGITAGRTAVGQMENQFAKAKAGPLPSAKVYNFPAGQEKQPMVGVGAAEAGIEKTRIERAKELPIPIDLSKDQATRNPADVRFARETAKDPVLGGALQIKYAEDNAKIQANLDKFVYDTGAEFSSTAPGELGQMLVNTIEPNKKARYAQIETAYNNAREAGHMNELIDINKLENYVEKHRAEAINAPVLSSVEQKLKSLTQGGKIGQIPINDLEELRKMTGTLAQSSGPNAHYGKEVIKLMDAITEGKGGELYKNARALNTSYMKEFENTPALKQITAMKSGGQERVVAMEKLVDKAMLQSPGDQVKQLFNSLERMGPEGQKMTQELRGAVAQRIKNEATKGVGRDINGKPYVSTQSLDKIITDLDKSGKLEFLFGKKGAEHYRTLNEVTKDLQTVPVGTTNPSGTASSILAALGEMGAQTVLTGVPVPVVAIGKHLYGKHKTKQQLNKINEFVNYSKENK
jgi:muramidase (phage lysozyme)